MAACINTNKVIYSNTFRCIPNVFYDVICFLRILIVFSDAVYISGRVHMMGVAVSSDLFSIYINSVCCPGKIGYCPFREVKRQLYSCLSFFKFNQTSLLLKIR